MAKISIKNEKITAFGGINFVLDKFDALLDDVIDLILGIRSNSTGYQYSEIIRALFSVYFCGGDSMEDINLFIRNALSDRPGTRIPSRTPFYIKNLYKYGERKRQIRIMTLGAMPPTATWKRDST